MVEWERNGCGLRAESAFKARERSCGSKYFPAGFWCLRTSVHEHVCAEPDGLSCTYGGAGSVDGFGGLEHKHSTSLRYESGSRT